MTLGKLFNFSVFPFYNYKLEIIIILHRVIVKIKENYTYKTLRGTSLAVQWLRLHASTAGGAGSIPGRETNLTCCPAQPKKQKEKQ